MAYGLAGAALVLCQARAARATSVDVGTADASPGGLVTVAVTLHSVDAVVVGVQNRIGFDRSVFIAPRPDGEPECEVNPGIHKDATAFRFLPVGCTPDLDCSAVRAFVVAFDNLTPLPDGALLYTCRVAVAPDAPPGDYEMRNDEVFASGPAAEEVAVDGRDGLVRVRTAEVAIDLVGGTVAAGGQLPVTARLRADGHSVAGTQNRIDFAPPLAVAARGDGSPDCAVNPALHKSATAFRFRPLGCEVDGDCRAVVAVVLSFEDLEPIPDGAVLYTCQVEVAADAAHGTYVLRNSELAASGPAGNTVPAGGDDAVIEVDGSAAIALTVDRVRAVAGQRIALPVTLSVLTAAGAGVAGTENELAFDPLTPVAPTGSGNPDCSVNPAIDKNGGGFHFLPTDCTPEVDCTGVRAFVLAVDNTDPIPDGAELYRCMVAVGADAPVGTYPVRIRNPAGADGSGGELSALGHDGAVDVICAGDCNGDGRVAIFELLRGVNMSLVGAPIGACPSFDADNSGDVAVNEIVQAVDNALHGCTMVP